MQPGHVISFVRFQQLINCKDGYGRTALQLAMDQETFSRVEILLDYGACMLINRKTRPLNFVVIGIKIHEPHNGHLDQSQ